MQIKVDDVRAVPGPGGTRIAPPRQGVDAHRPRGQLHPLPAAHPRVGAHAVDLDRGHGAGHLHDLAGQGAQRVVQAPDQARPFPGP